MIYLLHNISLFISKLNLLITYIFSSVQFISVTQLRPTLCDSMNRSTPGLPVHHQFPEFTQTRVHRVGDAIIQFMEFSRPEYWSGLSFPSLGDLPNPGIKLSSLALQTDSLPSEPPGKTLSYFKGQGKVTEGHSSNQLQN